MSKAKSHTVAIKMTVNRPITARQARFAVWNAINGLELYGEGSDEEPFERGKIRVSLSIPRVSKATGEQS